ncbi:hypothetical protein [Casimicrobium huifangae]
MKRISSSLLPLPLRRCGQLPEHDGRRSRSSPLPMKYTTATGPARS